MKKIYVILMMTMMVMSVHAYDKATPKAVYYGSGIQGVGLEDGTVAAYKFYTGEKGCFVDGVLYVPATLQVWEGEGEGAHMTAEYEVSTVGVYPWNPAIWVGEGETSAWSSVQKVVISEGVKKIAQGCFTTWAAATNLTEVQLPSTLTNIGPGAFAGCEGLVSITCDAETAPVLDNPEGWTDHFKGYTEWDFIVKNCTVYVPSETAKETYNQNGDAWTYWGSFYTNEKVVVKNPTAIRSLRQESKGDEAIFNLAGQRVNGNAKGLFIKNGKKYIVK